MFISRGIARGFSRSRGSSSRGGGSGYFDYDYWEKWYVITAENQKYKAGNPGQYAILEEFEQYTIDYCEDVGADYDAELYVEAVAGQFAEDGKYDAISEIVQQTSEELEFYWDQSYAGDGFGAKMFHFNL